jgi:16S rRNA (cytidine1402-2'-O)-methyltransferase
MAGTLFVVATPIGNLEDVTIRALRVLREVALVAAEDTRRSGQFLRHFGIQTKLLSVHEHNEGARTQIVLDRLARGESVALVTDAGTPAISDPGATLVAAAAAAGYRVEPVPGPSAVAAALSASGAGGTGFAFMGFPPIKAKDRINWFARLVSLAGEAPVVFFEAPHRIQRTLGELGNLVDDQVVVFRELTKMHESSYRGTPQEVLEQLEHIAGEFTVVVPRLSTTRVQARPDDDTIRQLFGQTAETTSRAAARRVAEATGLTPNEVYAIVQRRRVTQDTAEPIGPRGPVGSTDPE